MFILTATGGLAAIRAAADAFDEHPDSPADAVSWFEDDPHRFKLELYVSDEDDIALAREIIAEAAPDLFVHAAPVQDADWVAMSLDGLPAVQAGRFIVAGAHALRARAGGGVKLWIEASEAFGTGHHGTTHGCLMALEYILRRRRVQRVLDVGGGSGVLAIAAGKSGAIARAIEIDPRASDIARVNVAQNKAGGRVRADVGDGAKVQGRGYDLVFANILMKPLIRLAPRLISSIAPGGALILSGLTVDQEPRVRAAYENRGMVFSRRSRRETWSTLSYRKPGPSND
jgi:ribosomal protein L11 methyltransferase